MNTFGNNIKITFFGESHSSSIGVVIDGITPGIEINNDLISELLSRRRPKDNYSTSRVEQDLYEIISGVYNGITTGAPITCIIPNTNTRSADYEYIKHTPRPSHADYPATIKYRGFNDPRGGGIFSGRLTALYMIPGAIAKQILNQRNIYVASHIQQIYNIKDDSFMNTPISKELLQSIEKMEFPLINSMKEIEMKSCITNAKANLDSVGGIVETCIYNLPIGLGEPLFQSVESYLSSLLFSIPSVKAVEFGSGFDIVNMYGSEANDSYNVIDNRVQTTSNHNGGVLGGISNGMPIIIRVAIKPTPSIGQSQETVDLRTNQTASLEITGRHDPAIVHRVVHVINAALYYGTLDLLITKNANDWNF